MRRYLVTILLVVCVHFVHAQSYFRHITVEEGLSSNHVRSLLQDRHGFVWMGTDAGLHRFDGTDFKVYNLCDRCSGYTMLSLLEDDGVIWIGTDKGVYCFRYPTEDIVEFDARTEEGEHISTEVNSIRMDKDGNLWFSTMGQGVFRYNRNTLALERFDFPLCDNMIATVYVDASNQVWALTNWGSPVLSNLNKASDAFEEFELLDGGRKTPLGGGLALLEDSEQRFWIGTWNSGLYEIDRTTGFLTQRLSPEKVGPGLNHIHSLLEGAPGELLIGSDDGLMVYDADTHEWDLYEERISDSSVGLSSRFVYPLMRDREGGIWAGTYYGGVNYRSPFAGQIEEYSLSGSGGKVIGRFCEDDFRNIWIASDDGGLSRLNPRTGQMDNFAQGNVHALCMDGDRLWVGTYTDGVYTLDIKTGARREYHPVEGDPTSLDGTSSYAIFRDRDNHIWVATMGGINLYDRKRDCFSRMARTNSHTIDIEQDSDGNIWFATLGDGTYRFDSKTEKWKAFRHSSDEGSLPSDYVNCLFTDSDGTLWIGTAKGLCHYDPMTDSFVQQDISSSTSGICGIVEDNGVMWITTTHGLMRYAAGGKVQVFTASDGLLSNQFVPNSILKASDGRIYVGTTNGFNAFYPYQIHTNQTVAPVVLTSVVIDNEEVNVGDPLLPSSLTETSRVSLSYHHNAISIHYASLSYCVPYKNQFAYKLKGFDKDWNYVGNRKFATYTNLPAGTYTFYVKGTNNDALWNERLTALEIEVKPHPLLSLPFKVLYVVLIVWAFAALIYFVIRINDQKYIKEMNQLKETSEKEIAEARVKFFTTIAHEIRTPVSLIIGPLEKIMKKETLPQHLENDLRIIDRNSQRLLFLVNQLLDFRKVEQNAMDVHFVCQPIVPLLRSICERFEPTISQNGYRLDVDYPEDFEVCVDPEALTKLVSNLLTNASKYTKDYVRLSCGMDPSDGKMFRISVYDNGCGISAEEQGKIFLPFYQTAENKPGTGIGLSLVKSIAELHRGTVSLRSEVGSFSEFTVTLPVYQETSPVNAQVHEVEGVKTEQETVSIEDILNSEVVDLPVESKSCILIVDDNEEIVHFLSDTLSEQYNTLKAADGNEAVEILKTHPEVTLIVADWMMPGKDGIELCREVRADLHTCHIPFILLTAKTDDASKVMGMDCGADAYIEKPFSVQYLVACIKNLVGLRTVLHKRYTSSPLMPLAEVASTSMDNQFLMSMTQLIEAHFSDSNLTVDFLTEQMGISRSSLYNKIKSLTNKTPNELIQLMRLKKAAQLLQERKYRINEVCYMVGFNNPSYFSKCFYRQFGMKPGEFAAKSGE